MPTKKKRVGFIPREDVMKIIDKLSFENNLSNSKIISILVEEALSKRGIYNIETGKERQEFLSKNISIEDVPKTSINNKNPINVSQLDKNKIAFKKNFNIHMNMDNFDLQTYEKFVLFLKFQEMINGYDS